ncbi:enoyl-CoA hydratase/isomerase family protein [Bacteroidota bacterium]
MGYQNILTENLSEKVVLVTINRPKKLNALDNQTIAELSEVLIDLESDCAVGVILVTGSGEKSFVAGADISEFADFSIEEGRNLAKLGQESLFDLIENLSKPVIAAVNGFALGGGLELAMACHFRYASENAKMGLPEVSLGLIPGYGGTQRLPQLIGKGRAMELILSGNMIGAETALSYGLVNKVTSQENLISSCLEIANKITQNAPNSMNAAITAVNSGFSEGINGYEKEIEIFGSCFGTDDFIEGTTAFLEKRKPKF